MRIVISTMLFISAIAIMAALVAQEGPMPPAGPGAATPPGGAVPGTPPDTTTAPPSGPTPGTTRPATVPGAVAPTAGPPSITPTPRPAGRVASGNDLIPFTFENVQLSSIIKAVAESTGRNFLIQTPIAGTVLIYCPKMIRASTAFDILGMILDSQGYTMVVSEDPPLVFVTKKVGSQSLPTEIVAQEEGVVPEKKHELTTMVVVLKYVSVDDMQNILRSFISPNCVMTAYPAANFLLLKDEEVRLRYLLTIIKEIDVPGTVSKVTMVELKHADASETASLLMELMAEKAGGQVATTPLRRPPTPTVAGRAAAPGTAAAVSPTIVGTASALKIIPDARTNRLVILASDRDTEYILGLVKQLDVEPTEEMYPIRTYVAQYQSAEDLADALTSFVSRRQRAGTTRERRIERTGATRTTGAAARQTTAASRVPAAAGATAAAAEEAFFLADAATNMVLIQAPPQKLDMYMNLLRELDQPQRQVLIEVWVVEISSKSQLDIGVEFKSAEIGPAERLGPMQDEVFGGTNFDLGLDNLLSGSGFPSSGISLGIRSLTNTSLEVGGKVYYLPNLDTFLRALREDTAFNILSSPKLLAMNNELAICDVIDEISIEESRIGYGTTGQEEITGYYPGTYTSTYRRDEVGIKLQIVPQINSENSVIMEIDLEVGSIAGVEDIAQAGVRPVIAKRVTSNKVRVDNGRTIVISGLRRTDRTKTVTRVPILGQIPILGMLFSHHKTLAVNTNLLIFITPHIVSDTLDMLEVTDALKNQDLEKERLRFQPSGRTREPRPIRRPAGWEWKK